MGIVGGGFASAENTAARSARGGIELTGMHRI